MAEQTELTTDPLFDVAAVARKYWDQDPLILSSAYLEDTMDVIRTCLKLEGELPTEARQQEMHQALKRIESAGKAGKSANAKRGPAQSRPAIRAPSGPMLAAFAAVSHMDDTEIGEVIGLHPKTVGIQRRAGEAESIKPAQRHMLLIAAKAQRDALEDFIEKHKSA